MYKNPITKGQKAENYVDQVCIDIIKGLMRRRGEVDLTHKEFSDLIGIERSTWEDWRAFAQPKGKARPKKKPSCGMVFKAAHLANVKINLEVLS